MGFRDRTAHNPERASIDDVVASFETDWRKRLAKELERRKDLSLRLGERAMQGEYFGVAGFMAIGFPQFLTTSSEYKTIVRACEAVRQIRKGSLIAVGDYNMLAVYGIKTNSEGDKGLNFTVYPGTDYQGLEKYNVTADVMCSRALYGHNSSETGTMYGNNDTAYGVSFVDSFISTEPRPVREFTLVDGSSPGKYVADNTASYLFSDSYFRRLVHEQAQTV